MRLDADVRRCVVFLGHASGTQESFRAVGTGFFVTHDKFRFLATAQHIAASFDDAPFCIRVNRHDGRSSTMLCDPLDRPEMKWLAHPNSNVDLAVMPFAFNESDTGLDMLGFRSSLLLSDEEIKTLDVDVGDRCYAVGLFRLLQGSKRNVPIVHSGSIALMAGEEAIPVQDWLAPHSGAARYVDSHLVEMVNLSGLSGAPVFVKRTLWAVAPKAGFDEAGKPTIEGQTLIGAYDPGIKLLGIWSGSWEADPSAVSTAGRGNRVPVGMGSVVPAGRLMELLNGSLVAERVRFWQETAERNAASNAPACD